MAIEHDRGAYNREGTVIITDIPGFPRLLESPGFFFLKISGPGKSWKITLVLESPGN